MTRSTVYVLSVVTLGLLAVVLGRARAEALPAPAPVDKGEE